MSLLTDYDASIVHIPSDNKQKRLHEDPLDKGSSFCVFSSLDTCNITSTCTALRIYQLLTVLSVSFLSLLLANSLMCQVLAEV